MKTEKIDNKEIIMKLFVMLIFFEALVSAVMAWTRNDLIWAFLSGSAFFIACWNMSNQRWVLEDSK